LIIGGFNMDARLQAYEEKMKKTLEFLGEEYAAVRAGRANPHVLDKLRVDYYGTPTPIQQVGNVSVPEARIIQIAPWDKSMLKAIEKAILTSDIGINPQNDGKVIRLVFPPTNEERRKDLTKVVRKSAEETKVAVRNTRRDAVETVRKLKKNSEITEDDQIKAEKDLQKMTDNFIKEVDKIAADKEKEIMEV